MNYLFFDLEDFSSSFRAAVAPSIFDEILGPTDQKGLDFPLNNLDTTFEILNNSYNFFHSNKLFA
jgi:hypothetical protein